MASRLSLLLLPLCLLLASCRGGGAAAANDPKVIFITASPDGGSLQFRMDDEIAADALTYLGTSGDFVEHEFKGPEVDGYDVSVHDAGSTFEFERQAIVFAEDTDSVVLAHGIRNFGAGEELKRLRFFNFTVNRSAPVGNKSRLFVVHAIERSPGLLTPAVKLQNASTNPQFATGDIAPGSMSSILVDSGTATWFVRRSGTQADFVTQALTLDPASVYVVVLSGIEADADPAKLPKITLIKLTTVN